MGLAWSHPEAPFFAVRREGDRVVATGLPAAVLGHRIDLGDGRPAAGNWVEWRWDGSRLEVRNSTLRGYPLYISASNDAVTVSPSIDRLLQRGVDRALDLDAIAVFLTIGYFAGDDTPFLAIRRLPPAATLRWQAGHLSITSEPPRRPTPHGSREAAVATTAELVRSAVQRSLPAGGDHVMPLSGGRDSRHLLLELLHAGHPPLRCVTAHKHPHVWGGDVPYAAALSRELGLAHEVLTPGPLIADEWHKNRLTSYSADEHAWYGVVAAALNGRTSHAYDGLNGSTAFTRDYISPKIQKLSDQGRFADLARQLGRRHRGQPRYLELLAPSMRGELGEERAVAHIASAIERYAGGGEPYLAFRFWGRTVGELNLTSTLMLSGVPTAYTPFMDPEVVAFAWTIPSEHIDEGFHDDVIAHHFPDHARVPYRPRIRPQPSRGYLRQVNRDLFEALRRHSDGSLVDRTALLRRTAVGAVTGSDWITWGRRSALATWLIQLEAIVAGREPSAAA